MSAEQTSHLAELLRECLVEAASVRLALLFGSAARGQLRPDSDLDVGIAPVDGELPLSAELDLQLALERATGRAVHLVRLDRAPLLLRWQIAREGIVLLSRPPIARVLFLASTAAEHADYSAALQEAARRYRRRLVSGAAR